MKREAEVSRKSLETEINLQLNLDGEGKLIGETGLRFFDHLLNQLIFYSQIDLEIKARWDLKHHLIEDTMYLLGKALSEALGDRRGIKRYGWAVTPMDEVLVLTAVDLGGRTHYSVELNLDGVVEGINVSDLGHGIEALSRGLSATIHVLVLRPGNGHHQIEAVFKSLGLSLREAVSLHSSNTLSTKGVLDL